jgi:hypothetical protein
MHKDRLILLLFACCAFMASACDLPWEDDDDDLAPLPNRALASSPLLRAYYDTRTIPSGMRDLKIPEGKKDDEDEELTVQFEMSGAVTVDEVRTHLYILPPVGKSLNDLELMCRCIAPNGTSSAWKAVDIEIGSTFDPQVEIPFLFEFIGLNSSGTWRIQLKDPVDDKDGRAVFRNGSLHINRGGTGGLGAAVPETVSLDGTQGQYGILPEAAGVRAPLDIGAFGAGAMLANQFVFTSSFLVTSLLIRMSFYINEGVDFEGRCNWILVAPSGNWIAYAFPPTPTGTVTVSDTVTLKTFDIAVGSTPTGPLLNLHGEPSAGTWTLYLVDTEVDGNTAWLTTDEADTTINPDAGELTLELSGVN